MACRDCSCSTLTTGRNSIAIVETVSPGTAVFGINLPLGGTWNLQAICPATYHTSGGELSVSVGLDLQKDGVTIVSDVQMSHFNAVPVGDVWYSISTTSVVTAPDLKGGVYSLSVTLSNSASGTLNILAVRAT